MDTPVLISHKTAWLIHHAPRESGSSRRTTRLPDRCAGPLYPATHRAHSAGTYRLRHSVHHAQDYRHLRSICFRANSRQRCHLPRSRPKPTLRPYCRAYARHLYHRRSLHLRARCRVDGQDRIPRSMVTKFAATIAWGSISLTLTLSNQPPPPRTKLSNYSIGTLANPAPHAPDSRSDTSTTTQPRPWRPHRPSPSHSQQAKAALVSEASNSTNRSEIPQRLWHCTKARTLKIDALVTYQRRELGIEYKGGFHDETERKGADAEREAVLAQMGYRIVTLTSAQFANQLAFHRAMNSIREALGMPAARMPSTSESRTNCARHLSATGRARRAKTHLPSSVIPARPNQNMYITLQNRHFLTSLKADVHVWYLRPHPVPTVYRAIGSPRPPTMYYVRALSKPTIKRTPSCPSSLL